MTATDFEVLGELPRDQFDHREWVALQWVRNYLVFEGTFPNAELDAELDAEFENLYSPRERTCIFAIFKLMLFFNMLVNTLAGNRYAEGAACEIRAASGDERTLGDN